MGTDGLPLTAEGDARRHHAVICFRRAVSFPRFAMAAGERWSFVVYGKNRERLEKIRSGERFEFAGGLCLAEDVEILYEGPCGLQEAIAAGRVVPTRDGDEV
jgi:hypothetical protein